MGKPAGGDPGPWPPCAWLSRAPDRIRDRRELLLAQSTILSWRRFPCSDAGRGLGSACAEDPCLERCPAMHSWPYFPGCWLMWINEGWADYRCFLCTSELWNSVCGMNMQAGRGSKATNAGKGAMFYFASMMDEAQRFLATRERSGKQSQSEECWSWKVSDKWVWLRENLYTESFNIT